MNHLEHQILDYLTDYPDYLLTDYPGATIDELTHAHRPITTTEIAVALGNLEDRGLVTHDGLMNPRRYRLTRHNTTDTRTPPTPPSPTTPGRASFSLPLPIARRITPEHDGVRVWLDDRRSSSLFLPDDGSKPTLTDDGGTVPLGDGVRIPHPDGERVWHRPHPGRCCPDHVDGPYRLDGTAACCDSEDCGPCCPACPTCPTVHARREPAAPSTPWEIARALLVGLFGTERAEAMWAQAATQPAPSSPLATDAEDEARLYVARAADRVERREDMPEVALITWGPVGHRKTELAMRRPSGQWCTLTAFTIDEGLVVDVNHMLLRDPRVRREEPYAGHVVDVSGCTGRADCPSDAHWRRCLGVTVTTSGDGQKLFLDPDDDMHAAWLTRELLRADGTEPGAIPTSDFHKRRAIVTAALRAMRDQVRPS